MFPTPRFMRKACNLAAVANTLQDMRPVLEKAEEMRCVLYLACQRRYFTISQLKAEWRKGRYIWGPSWWRLVPEVQAKALGVL